MKVVFTVNTYYPLKDGVQFVTQYQAEGLAKLGFKVKVITVKQPGMSEHEYYNGVEIIRYNIRTVHALHQGDKTGYRELVINECEDADALINVCTQTATTEVLFPVLKQIKCKKILYMHGMHDFKWHRTNFNSISSIGHKLWNNIRWRYDYLINRNIFSEYDSVVQLHGEDDATYFFKAKFGLDSVIIENAADDRFFDISQIKNNTIVCVSNFDERKNQEFLIEAFYQARIKNWKLVLIGSQENKYSSYLKSKIREFSKNNDSKEVQILTNISRDKTINYVREASIYVLGSKWEAFPISLVESMAAGVPFLSTDVGIVKYFPGGKIVNTPAEMARWLELFQAYPEVRNRIGSAGHEYAESRMKIGNKVESLRQVILGERN